MKKRQSQYSTEYVEAIVFAENSPVGNAVEMVFPLEDAAPGNTGLPADWKPGSWDGQKAIARCLVGPAGSDSLAPATYDVYVKWTESPEVPLILAGQLEVF